MHIDNVDAFVGGYLVDQGNFDIQIRLIDPELAMREDGTRTANKDARLGGQALEGFDHVLVIGDKLVVMHPVLRLGVVRAQHDDHDVWIKDVRILEELLFPNRSIAVFQQSPSADAEVLHVPFVAEQRL